jgi:hypothetical protein
LDSTVGAAVSFAGGQVGAGNASVSAAALADQVIRSLVLSRIKLLGVFVLVIGVLVSGVGVVAYHAFAVPEAGSEMSGTQETATVAPRVPAKATFLGVKGGKPPLRFFRVALDLENPRDYPVWFLTRYYGDKPLAANGVFKADGGPSQPFGGQGYDAGKGKVVAVHYLGNDPFIGLYVPANARIKYDEYTIEAWDDITGMELWEVSSLKVNGRTPLEKWLPYETTSDSKAIIPAQTDWTNFDWDAVKLRSRTDYPKEEVKTVNASGVSKWTIPIKAIKKIDPWK